MIKAYRIIAFLLGCGLLASIARAETFHMADGQTLTGEIVSMDGTGAIVKQADGSYGDRIPWSKFSQDTLKELDQNPKAAQYVDAFIEPGMDQKPVAQKTQVEIKDYPKLARPVGHSLIGALFTAPMGILIVLLVYAANIYAAYEISLFRAQPVGLVCGVSAALPILGPIIYLSMPTKLKQKEASWKAAEQHVDENIAAIVAADQAVPAEAIAAEAVAAAPAAAPAQAAAPALPPPKIFARGQFTFNRRFFETQVPAFFAVTRPESEKDKILEVKATRGTFIAERIARISATEMFLQVNKGHVSEEVAVPFVEIQEVQLKHKGA